MKKKFTIEENSKLFEMECDQDGLIFLLNHDLKDSKLTNGKKTYSKTIESAKIAGKEMLYEMGIIS